MRRQRGCSAPVSPAPATSPPVPVTPESDEPKGPSYLQWISGSSVQRRRFDPWGRQPRGPIVGLSVGSGSILTHRTIV